MATKRTGKKEPKLTEDEEIIKEARERFHRCEGWEMTARARYLEDIKFVNGDSDNGWQWPQDVRKNRDVDQRPVLTINKTRQYCLNITNDAKQNKSSVKVRPVGNRATSEGAQVMEGIVRHVEYRSTAASIYDRANVTQVQGGAGYWRVVSEYADPDSFDQELRIKPIKDPLSVYIDPDCSEADYSDMNFGFIFESVDTDRFETDYPKYKDTVGGSSLGEDQNWHSEHQLRICEYYRRVQVEFKLISMTDPQTKETKVIRSTGVPKEILKEVLEDPDTKTRTVKEWKVEWFKIAGDQIVDRTDWVGTTIPIIKIVGEEYVIEGQMDRKGHVRMLKDPARMYNYWSSSAVEFVALQSKSPFIGAAQAIEGYETYWNTANKENHSILPFNHKDDDGTPLPPPQRQNPPTMAMAYIDGLKISAEEMRMASGQYQEDMGEQSQAISGKAINARQRQGDNATYHFVDNQALGIAYTGKILIECIPKIYDTQRTLKILGEDGVESSVLIDPNAKAEYQEQQVQNQDKINIIFNPSFAKYSVEADVGPGYATRRQEAFNAFTQILSNNPDLFKIAGDLMFRAADFPMADELADRLKRLVPPEILGKGPSPQVKQLLMQNQNLTQQLQTMMQQYAEDRLKRVSTEQQKDIDIYKAETDRLKVLVGNLDPKQIASMTAELVLAAMNTNLANAAASVDQGLNNGQPPVSQ